MKNTKVIRKLFLIVFSMLFLSINYIMAEFAFCDDYASSSTTLNVNVNEVLSVSITTPVTWATGNIDTFLRNKVSIQVVTNNAAGFTASMTTKTTNTSLVNTSKSSVTLPTLSARYTRSSFPANYWGYSLGTTATLNNQTYNETDAGNNSSYYYPLVSSAATPITVLTSNVAANSTQDIYFGAKANITKAAGTYMGTVVISVVTGVINNDNPITPVDPVTPGGGSTPTYDPTSNITAYTSTTSSGGTSTTHTEVSRGDNRSAYADPQGVRTSTETKIQTGVTLATALGIAASVAATSGFFFLAAARREGEDDEEDGTQQF